MQIYFTPVRMDADLFVTVAGDVLTVNGEAFDFTPLPDNMVLPRDAVSSDWFAGDVSRVEGVLQLTLLLPHGGDAPDWMRYPDPVIAPLDGAVVSIRNGTPAQQMEKVPA